MMEVGTLQGGGMRCMQYTHFTQRCDNFWWLPGAALDRTTLSCSLVDFAVKLFAVIFFHFVKLQVKNEKKKRKKIKSVLAFFFFHCILGGVLEALRAPFVVPGG